MKDTSPFSNQDCIADLSDQKYSKPPTRLEPRARNIKPCSAAFSRVKHTSHTCFSPFRSGDDHQQRFRQNHYNQKAGSLMPTSAERATEAQKVQHRVHQGHSRNTSVYLFMLFCSVVRVHAPLSSLEFIGNNTNIGPKRPPVKHESAPPPRPANKPAHGSRAQGTGKDLANVA